MRSGILPTQRMMDWDFSIRRRKRRQVTRRLARCARFAAAEQESAERQSVQRQVEQTEIHPGQRRRRRIPIKGRRSARPSTVRRSKASSASPKGQA